MRKQKTISSSRLGLQVWDICNNWAHVSIVQHCSPKQHF